MTSNTYKMSRGFTLIEVMVSVAILAIMAAVTITSMNGGRNRQEVGVATRIVAATLREAQNNALTGKNITGTASGRPCQFRVQATMGTGTITHEQLPAGDILCPGDFPGTSTGAWSGASAELLNGVTFSASTEVYFDVPRGEPKNSSGVPGVSGAELTSGVIDFAVTKGTDTAHVCVYPLGRIEETAVGALCP